MKELVEVIAKELVDNPDEVVVTEKTEGKTTVIELHVAASDMGKGGPSNGSRKLGKRRHYTLLKE